MTEKNIIYLYHQVDQPEVSLFVPLIVHIQMPNGQEVVDVTEDDLTTQQVKHIAGHNQGVDCITELMLKYTDLKLAMTYKHMKWQVVQGAEGWCRCGDCSEQGSKGSRLP